MDLLDLVAKITLDTKEYERGVKQTGISLDGLASKIKKVAKVVAGAYVVKKTIDAVKNLTTASIEAYAEYEADLSAAWKRCSRTAPVLFKNTQQTHTRPPAYLRTNIWRL